MPSSSLAAGFGDSWIDAKLQRSVEVYPTHWQEWIGETT